MIFWLGFRTPLETSIFPRESAGCSRGWYTFSSRPPRAKQLIKDYCTKESKDGWLAGSNTPRAVGSAYFSSLIFDLVVILAGLGFSFLSDVSSISFLCRLVVCSELISVWLQSASSFSVFWFYLGFISVSFWVHIEFVWCACRGCGRVKLSSMTDSRRCTRASLHKQTN